MNPPTSTAPPKWPTTSQPRIPSLSGFIQIFLDFWSPKTWVKFWNPKVICRAHMLFSELEMETQTPPKNLELPKVQVHHHLRRKKKWENNSTQVMWIVAPAYASRKPPASCVLVLGRTHRMVMDISYHDLRRCRTALPAMCLGRFPMGDSPWESNWVYLFQTWGTWVVLGGSSQDL